MKQQHRVYLGLGSNVGKRKKQIKEAIFLLEEKISIDKISSFYESKAMYVEDQPDFINIVCTGKTLLEPLDLLDFTQSIEKKIGRKKTYRNGPRVIDIDILRYDSLSFSHERLVLPHPRIQERSFVLEPLEELD